MTTAGVVPVLCALRNIPGVYVVPAMLVAVVFRYIFAFRIFSEVWLLTGGGPARSTEVPAGTLTILPSMNRLTGVPPVLGGVP